MPDICHQGTTLITNLSSVLKDETVWEKPFRFHPGQEEKGMTDDEMAGWHH